MLTQFDKPFGVFHRMYKTVISINEEIAGCVGRIDVEQFQKTGEMQRPKKIDLPLHALTQKIVIPVPLKRENARDNGGALS